MFRVKLMVVILLFIISTSSLAEEPRGPLKPVASARNITAEVEAVLDLGNLDVEQTAVTIARDYPGEYNLNQVSEVFEALRKGWYYYSDPSYKDKYKSANRSLQDGKISNSIGMGDCDDFAILMASLLESLQGSTRIVFAYDQDTRLNHAYAEVYLGKKSDPRVDDLISWLKDQYNQTGILGQVLTGDEVWLNLDYNSIYPGGPYFGGQRVVREVVWQSASRNSPKIVPIIDTMDNTTGWETIGDEKGSTVSISSVPSPKGKAVQMDFDLKEEGKAGISRNISGSILSQVKGLNFTYYGPYKQITIQLILGYQDGTRFGYSWKPEPGNKWAGLEALFEDFARLGPDRGSDSDAKRLDPNRVDNLEIICQLDGKDSAGTGRIIIDHIRGVMNTPSGSPWARAEEQRETTLAIDLAGQSEEARKNPEKLIESVQLAVESISNHVTLGGDQTLRRGLALLPDPVFRLAHDSQVNDVIFSPDGIKLATASSDGTVRIWIASSGKKIFQLNLSSWPSKIIFSPDGSKAATISSDNNTSIWDTGSGKMLHTLRHNNTINAISFSPDGIMLATACDDKIARIWDVESGKELIRFEHSQPVIEAVFSPDGSKIATSSMENNTVIIWDMASKKPIARLVHNCDSTELIFWLKIAFSSDGKRLITAADYDSTIRVWSLESFKEILSLPHNNWVEDFDFNPKANKIAAAYFDKKILIWDAKSSCPITQIELDDEVNKVILSPNGRLLAACGDSRSVEIFDTETGHELIRLNHADRINAITFSPNGQFLATASEDKTARIWKIKSPAGDIRFYHDFLVDSVAFSPDGRKLATYTWETAQIFDLVSGTKRIWRDLDWNDTVNAIYLGNLGCIAATINKNGTVRLWDIDDIHSRMPLAELNDTKVVRVIFSQNGEKIATISQDNAATIWSALSGEKLAILKHNDSIEAVTFSPDGSKVATASNDGIAKIWDSITGRELNLRRQDFGLVSASFSPDNSMLATGNYDKVRIWNVTSGNETLSFDCKCLGYDCMFSPDLLVFSPDGKKLAAAGNINNSAIIWDVVSPHETVRLDCDNYIEALVFSPDGTKIATASKDKTALLWETSSGKELAKIEHDDIVRSIAFDPSGNRLATASGDVAYIWSLLPQDLICEACSRLGCNLTSQEWRDKYCSKCDESNPYLAR